MRVLDLDLDCFIEGISYFSSDDGDRLDDQEYPPWNESKFRHFLENQCGLSSSDPINGGILKHHKDAFPLWRDLIGNRILTTPFEVVHVDAHSDMGLGEASWVYIMTKFLFLRQEEKPLPENVNGFLTSGSYLAFALACGWLSELTFVHHTEWPDNDDLMWIHFKDYDDQSGFIQLKAYRNEDISVDYIRHNPPTLTEPEIPITICPVQDYRAVAAFDVATLCQSPGFTPESADVLLDVFREYIIEI